MRGLRRDRVKLLVVDRDSGSITHTRFHRIGDYLSFGDLLVVNSSRTLPSAIDLQRRNGGTVQLRLCVRRLHRWDFLAVQPLPPHANVELEPGEDLLLDGQIFGTVLQRRWDIPFLWEIDVRDKDLSIFAEKGMPVRYSYVPDPIPVDYYQTVFATQPGSAEMPSAGRPFSWELVRSLGRRGISFADIVLHTGLSSYQDDDYDAEHHLYEERYEISRDTAAAVERASRVVAVGTTVVRTLESAAVGPHTVPARSGWTNLRVSAGSPMQAVDALITGMHEPQASHFELLEAFVDRDLLERAYAEAVERRYLWHEFGDSMLIV
jgi:S-adenosylmethionine:tRNA ribosyltransferase-isomerase